MEKITKHQALENIVSNITTQFNIEQIYLNSYEQQDVPHELIILVSNKYVKTLGDLIPRILNAIIDYPQYKVLCYVAFQAMNKIKEGNLFLFTSCQPKKLIYSKEDSDFILIPENFDFSKCKELAITYKNREQQKIDEFKEGYYNLKSKGKYSVASFMLHQAIELTYRYLEQLLIAKERITHSIRSHHQGLKEISSLYKDLFIEDETNDKTLLETLDEVYKATRYENNFQIDVDILESLEVKMEALHANAQEIFDHIIFEFEKIFIENQEIIEETISTENEKNLVKLKDGDGLKEAVEQITSNITEPISIYLFGKRTRSFISTGINTNENNAINDYYFDLLAISNTDLRDHLNNLQTLINERLGINLFILSFTKDQIQKQLDNNSPFFHQVLGTKGALLHDGLNVNDWQLHDDKGVLSKDEFEKAKRNWFQRMHKAMGFLNGGRAIEDTEQIMIKVFLYNQSLEQTCLGLLEYFYKYSPYQYNLNHLYNLCASFWNFPNDIFPNSNKEEKRFFKDLVQVVKEVRYKGLSYPDWDEAYRYEARCERFLEESTKIINEASNKKLEEEASVESFYDSLKPDPMASELITAYNPLKASRVIVVNFKKKLTPTPFSDLFQQNSAFLSS